MIPRFHHTACVNALVPCVSRKSCPSVAVRRPTSANRIKPLHPVASRPGILSWVAVEQPAEFLLRLSGHLGAGCVRLRELIAPVPGAACVDNRDRVREVAGLSA